MAELLAGRPAPKATAILVDVMNDRRPRLTPWGRDPRRRKEAAMVPLLPLTSHGCPVTIQRATESSSVPTREGTSAPFSFCGFKPNVWIR